MGSITAVGIHDDLSAGEAAVAYGAADDETAGGIDIELGVGIQKIGRQSGTDDLFDHSLTEILDIDLSGMLGGDDHIVNALHAAVRGILYGNLALAIRAQPVEVAVLALGSELLGELMGIGDGGGHELFGLVAGIAEHHALVTGAQGLGIVIGAVNAHGDVAGLLVNGGENGAVMAVEAGQRRVVADPADGLTNHMGNIHIAAGGDLACH